MRSRVQGLFHPPRGVLFTFPSRYLCAIGRVSSLALEGGPPGFPQDFPCPVVLRISAPPSRWSAPTGLSPSRMRLSNRFGSTWDGVHGGSFNPAQASPPARFGLLPVRSPLLRESRLISVRQATEMFQFAHRPPLSLCIQERVSRHHSGGVAPFGFSRLLACMQLPLNVSPVSASFIGLTRPGIHRERCPACGGQSIASLPDSPGQHHTHPCLWLR